MLVLESANKAMSRTKLGLFQTEPDQENLHTILAKKHKVKKVEISNFENEHRLLDDEG